MKLRLSALLSCFLLACGEEETRLPCDIREHACQSAVFRAVSETRAQEGAVMPPVRVISRRQLADELRAALSESTDEESRAEVTLATNKQQGLSLLALMPEPSTQSADEAYIAQSVATIAAYYSHSSHDVTVIADQAEARDDATVTLAHEFVHALQDQREGLSRLQQQYTHSSDEEVAFTSLVEGEATWLSYVTYYREAQHIAYEALNHQRAFESILDKTLQTIHRSQAPLLDASELLPYPVGGEYVAAVHLARGLPALAALFEDPPPSLRAYIDDDYDGTLPLALGCELPAAPEGYERIATDRLGFAGLLAFASSHVQDEAVAFEAARAWRADQLAVYALAEGEPGDESNPGEQDAVAVSWSVLLDTPAAAEDLLGFIQAGPGSLSAAVHGNSLLVSAATDPTLLAAWQPAASCPPAAKTRTRGDDESLHALLRKRLGITR